MKYVFLLFILFAFQFCNQPVAEKNIGEKIAEANGLDDYNKIEMLEFTFNAQRDTAKPNSRHWQWFPKKNEVIFITDSMQTKFTRYDTTTEDLKKLNARFTNDEYWLIYPYHLAWDKGFELVDGKMQAAPISGKSLQKFTTKYNKTDGFTPGDWYDVYVDENNRIQEWAYFKEGAAEPSLMTSWEDYKDFNGMKLAQMHKSKDGNFKIFFTGIQVK